MGGAGAGKSAAKAIGCELVPYVGDAVADDLPLGSGEGLIELFFDMVSESVDGKAQRVKRQTRHGAFVFLDEGQALAELGARKGSTLAPTLRTAWSGQVLGSANASTETKRRLPVGSYGIGLVIGFQPEMAGELLADSIGGTPQRFVWLSATDPTLPDVAPEWPGALQWVPPPPRSYGGHMFPVALVVDPTIANTIRLASLAVSRGTAKVVALDEHGNLLQLKVAGLLAILDDRTDITTADWELAAMVRRASNAVRGVVIAHVAIAHRKAEDVFVARHVAREGAVVDNHATKALHNMARAIGRHVHRGQCEGGCNRRCVQRAPAGRDRALALVDDAIDRAVELRWIRADGDAYVRGDAVPT